MKKFLCKCGELATWNYVPSTEQHYYKYYCDKCVPRGCDCHYEFTVDSVEAHENGYGENPPTEHSNWIWIKEDAIWTPTDEQGREYPCVEYGYCNDGFETYPEELEYYEKHNIEYFTN